MLDGIDIQRIIEPATLTVISIVWWNIKTMHHEIKKIRDEMHEYVRNELCDAHREVIRHNTELLQRQIEMLQKSCLNTAASEQPGGQQPAHGQ